MSPDDAALIRFRETGWLKFPQEPAVSRWIAENGRAIDDSISDPDNAVWWRYGKTWFVGVNVLPNDATTALPDGAPLSGRAYDFVTKGLGFAGDWDRGQVSVCRPGYPQPADDESAAVFAFRRDRDAAHIDGLRHEGPDRRRFLKDYHAFILGIVVSDHPPDAAPFTIWEGSHRIIGDWLRSHFDGHEPADWPGIDLTDSYQAIRKHIFETCRRVPIPARPGETYVVHRHALHGVAPWPSGEGQRTIVYFRPHVEPSASWLDDR